jgi:hypothetical protein
VERVLKKRGLSAWKKGLERGDLGWSEGGVFDFLRGNAFLGIPEIRDLREEREMVGGFGVA